MSEHAFDRRGSDGNVSALALRVGILEGRVENIELGLADNNRELAANTRLTKQTHERVEAMDSRVGEISANTQTVVNAVRWFSTTKRLATALVVGLGAVAGTIVATVKALHMLGLLH